MRDQSYQPKPVRRPDGRGVVRLNGRDHYLGQAGDWPKSHRKPPPLIQAAYDVLIGRWLNNGRQLPEEQSEAAPTVNEVILAYYKYAEVHYQRESNDNPQLVMIRDAVRVVKDLFGRTPAHEFGPKKLKAVQVAMTAKDWCRNYVNEQVHRVKRMFKWAVQEELVPGTVWHALQAVEAIKQGTPGVRESEPVKPVPEAFVRAAEPFLPDAIRPMIKLQELTGMRPGEVCIMRTCDIDIGGAVWLYKPRTHKTAHRGKERVIPLGPKAQAIVRPLLKLDLQGYLFDPREAEAQRKEKRRQERRSPMTPSQAKRKAKGRRKRLLRDHYDETSLRNAVYRACAKADAEARRVAAEAATNEGKEPPAEDTVFVPRWHPNQLRHNHATEVRKRFGLEAAQVMLGHSKADVTQVYAERDLELAVRVAGEVG